MKNLKKVMKKWWVTALVFTLALSLTSCAKKKKEELQSSFGYKTCDDSSEIGDTQTPSIGSFDIELSKSKTNPEMYDLVLKLIQPITSGDIVSITVWSSQTRGFKQMVDQVVLTTEEQIINVGVLTTYEAELYDIISITPYDPTTSVAFQEPESANFCYIPQIGEGNTVEDQTSVPQY